MTPYVDPKSTSSIASIVLSNRKAPAWSARWFALGVGITVHLGVGLASAMLPPPAPAVLARQPVRTHILTGLPSDVVNARLEPSSGLAWLNSASPVSTRATRLSPPASGVMLSSTMPSGSCTTSGRCSSAMPSTFSPRRISAGSTCS